MKFPRIPGLIAILGGRFWAIYLHTQNQLFDQIIAWNEIQLTAENDQYGMKYQSWNTPGHMIMTLLVRDFSFSLWSNILEI